MTRERRSATLAGMLAFALALAPTAAHAFCRATTEAMSPACPSACPTGGVPLAWGTPEIEYAFNQNTFVDSNGPALRQAVVRSFQHWADVTCGGQPIGFTFMLSALDTEQTLRRNQNTPSINVITALSASEWSALGLDPHAFAKTQLWFDEETGEIVAADLAFNGSLGALTVCPETGCPAEGIDLENVATHELGHFLGLAHSVDPSATMWCDAVKGDLQKRTLAPDDELGLCSIYGSRTVFLDPIANNGASASGGSTAQTSSGGCALGEPNRSEPPLLPLLLLGLSALRARRKKLTILQG